MSEMTITDRDLDALSSIVAVFLVAELEASPLAQRVATIEQAYGIEVPPQVAIDVNALAAKLRAAMVTALKR